MPRVTVVVTDGLGRPIRVRGLAAWVARAAPRRASGRVAIALVSDAMMRRLNRTYRGVDAVTDVLSFPVARSAGGRRRPAGDRADDSLGDIAIASGVARRQARAYGHPLATELRVLALHGMLHLLGYDHECDQGQMRRLEERLRRRAGLAAGVIARARMSPGPR